MEFKKTTFGETMPFVRHVRFTGIEPVKQAVFLKTYDCRMFYVYGGTGYFLIEGTRYDVKKETLLCGVRERNT